MVNKILYRKRLFEQKHKQWSTKYYTETTIRAKAQIMVSKILYRKRLFVNKILYRKRLFEQKHKQWSTKYYTENNYLSKNTNNG